MSHSNTFRKDRLPFLLYPANVGYSRCFYKILAWVWVAFLGYAQVACTDRKEVKVIGKNFDGEVKTLQNLVFTFNREIWPEGRLESWDSTRLVVFEPDIPGRFRWSAPNELIFSPSIPLKSAAAYKAKLAPGLLKYADRSQDLKVSTEEILFHTPYLALEHVKSWWMLSPESGRPEPRALLSFNYPVDMESLRKHLRILQGDKALEYKILPSRSQSAVLVALYPQGKIEAPTELKAELGKGVKIESDGSAAGHELTGSFVLPSPLELTIGEMTSGFEDNRGYINVYTSQELAGEPITASITLQPQIPFTAEPTENGFVVRADFEESETYVLQVGKTLKGALGQTLKEEVSRDFFFGKMPETIQFVTTKAQYLSPRGSRNVGLNITNVPRVEVRISKIYSNNLLFYLTNGRYENYAEINGAWGPDGTYNYSDDYAGQYSDLLVKKNVATADLPEVSGVKALNISIPEIHGNSRKGVYLVKVASADVMYLSAQKLVSVSDIGLVVKQGRDEVWVFANSIYDAAPLKNVEIKLISSNNQEMHTMTTDANGVAHVAGLSEKAPGFRLALVTAGMEEDFNYLALNDARVETSRYDVEGARANPAGIQAFVYGERDVYRPGETLHFVSVIRTEDWKTAAGYPVKLRLLTPNGKVYGSWLKETDSQGGAELAVQVDEGSLTGAYTLEVYNANEVLLTSSVVNVEEFVPDRIKVDLARGRTRYEVGETLRMEATATNLFGPPAANRTYEMEFQLKRRQFSAPDFAGYEFEIPAEVSFERIRVQGKTDAAGKATGDFVIPTSYRDVGMLEGKVFVTVFDENGRPVNRVKTFEVSSQPVLYGIRLADRYVGLNIPVLSEIVAVDPSGKLKTGATAAVEVVRITYQTVIEKRQGRMQYTSKRKEEKVYEQTISLKAGKGAFRYTPTVSAEYEIRIRRPGADRFAAVIYHAYGYNSTRYSSFEVSSEGNVLIETDKERYHAGDKARVLFKAPFDGRLLVTIEQGEVLSHQVVQTKNKAAELVLPVTVSYLPNVYISATLIRPMKDEQIPLTVAHGFKPLLVEAGDRKLDVRITAATQSRSANRQVIRVKTQPNAAVTVAVVDEGILQIRNFVTPDIYGHFYAKRALEVEGSDLYALLFPELALAGKSSPGGDGYSLERRINPLSNGNKELVRFWSGVLKANGKGEVAYEVNLPGFSGSLRVMAVAFKDQAFGSASHQMKVADPIILSAGVPRFLSPGDELLLPVTVSNTENRDASGRISVYTEGALEPLAFAGQAMNLLKGSEERFQLKIKAGKGIGESKVIVRAEAFGEKFERTYQLSVRPASPLLKVSGAGVLNGGETTQLDLRKGFIAGTSRVQLVIGRSPLIQGGGKAFATLLGYPHGCLEQTVSKAFPQLYFGDLAKGVAASVYALQSGNSDLNPVHNVQQAIRKVESGQLFNGGFGMWPGSVEDDWWVSAYALQFLDEARRAGFEVNGKAVSNAVNYLNGKSGKADTETVAVNNPDNSRGAKKIASAEAIYSLYVLASTGNANRAMMNYYKQRPQLLTSETRYLLAGAYHYIGDQKSYRALLPEKYVADNRFAGQPYQSPLSSLGLLVNMLVDTDPQNMQIPVLARQLSVAISEKDALNTQEAAFAILALGKIARKAALSSATAEVVLGRKSIGKYEGKKELSLTKGLLAGPVTLKAGGAGKLYWFSETSGFDPSGRYTEEDDGLRVRRQYLDRNGRPLKAFRLNDLVVVKITLAATNRIDVPNVVITDLLPAGFEVENPRLTESRDFRWIKTVSAPDYFDIRDDRIHYFVSAEPREKVFYYQVRVTADGTFNVGPVAADAMYQTHLKSYSGGGVLVVK
ncbi:alpha-2-macroglobulin family protein [Ravibacter arvi]|uniref:Alpha-2-macroglobulin family protein n=1 Tax=Ravibacter arvi TaxID=2051041 RepID=A0ABP8MA02_9BACT